MTFRLQGSGVGGQGPEIGIPGVRSGRTLLRDLGPRTSDLGPVTQYVPRVSRLVPRLKKSDSRLPTPDPCTSSPKIAHSFAFLLLLLCLGACGHKTPVRPPEWVVPEAIGDLALDVDSKKNALVLRWGRPDEEVDGSTMDNLSGFVVLRATQSEQGQAGTFAQVATLAVTDRDRFRKAKKFSYTDTELTPGVLYRYRVQSVTLDGYSSGMSNTVEIVWKETPAEAPAPAKVPPPIPPAKAPTKRR